MTVPKSYDVEKYHVGWMNHLAMLCIYQVIGNNKRSKARGLPCYVPLTTESRMTCLKDPKDLRIKEIESLVDSKGEK